jgi:hypothetical protein
MKSQRQQNFGACIRSIKVNNPGGLPMAVVPPLWRDRDVRRAAKLAREQGIVPNAIEIDCKNGVVRVTGTPSKQSVERTAQMKPYLHQRSGEA